MLIVAVVAYAAAMLIANLTVAAFGPWVSPINSFFLIGLDLTLRDWLHVRLHRGEMLALILVTGWFTYVLNPAAGMIAVASSVSFTVAALVDWAAFLRASGSWFSRSNKSNVTGAAVDSVLFPTIAFGALMPTIVLAQFAAKVGGGLLWSMALQQRKVA